ncbi:MAG: LysR substrate-binding domain-containing protein [Methyloligellaceae bacterium]
MNHSQLRAFHAVALEGSFTRAAAVLGVSQPTLSGHVKALETGYGVKLFNRGGREVTMTDFGHALFEITQRYFASQAEAQRLLSKVEGLIQGRLRCWADSPFTAVPLMAAFKGRFPTVQIDIEFGNSAEVLKNVLENVADVGILASIPPDKRLHILPFREDRLVVFVDRGHPWSQKRSVRLEEVAEQTLVLREAGSTTRAIFERALTNRRIEPKSVLVMEGREAVREAVAAGLGIGVVCDYEFGFDTRLHKLDVNDADLQLTECAVCRRDSRIEPVVSAFLDIVEETARQVPSRVA